MLAYGFRYYFIPLIGVLFTFPSRYLFAIDLMWYLALEDSAPIFKRDFSGPALLVLRLSSAISFSSTGLSPSLAALSRDVWLTKSLKTQGCSLFARHYSGNLCWFLFLLVLRCFSSQGTLHYPMNSDNVNLINQVGLSHSEISGSKVARHLPEAYRRLLRPSSLTWVKASTIRIKYYRS